MSHVRSTNRVMHARSFELRYAAQSQNGRGRVHCGKGTPKGFRQQLSLNSGSVCKSQSSSLTLTSAALDGNQSARQLPAASTCRKAVCLSYNANRTQEPEGAWIGMRVALVLLGYSYACYPPRRLKGTAPKHASYKNPSCTQSSPRRLSSVTRTGFTCSHNHLCRELTSRQDFRKASIS
jgi:hypothetical protein